jgi:hypothetical protein
MKSLYSLAVAMLFALAMNAQPFNFFGSNYYIVNSNEVGEGTVLTDAAATLASFNYNNAPTDHPLLNEGVFYPIQDCSNQNIWVRVQHIAADPNGIENGHAISQTMNSPFHPSNSTDRIGGWNGFLYEFQIFGDQALTGTRTNILGPLHPTNITVASLETLYNDGGTMFEWLSFEILNEETGGWYLNSTNFTGINPQSNPGFSAELNYSTTGTSTSAPTGFSTDFPSGSPTVYAVDMNLSASFHSEFKMTASAVSIFQYGYEFTLGGYQGMSMEFGVAPAITLAYLPSCGENSGTIFEVQATGTEPLQIEWENGNTLPLQTNLPAGAYTVHVTDANGCTSSQTITIEQFDEFDVHIEVFLSDEYTTLQAVLLGGTPEYIYLWNTGSTSSFIETSLSGDYTIEVIDHNGCLASASYTLVSVEENELNNRIKVWPNPIVNEAQFLLHQHSTEVRITTMTGQIVASYSTLNQEVLNVDFSSFATGNYLYQILTGNEISHSGKLLVTR